MKLILDGCDLTGKTTLIKKIVNYYNDDRLSYLHFSYKDRTDYEFYNTMLDKENFISDRHFIDEVIYPIIFDREFGITHEEFQLLMNKCKAENIKIIILTVDNQTLLERLNVRGENEEAVRNRLLDINNMFIDLANEYDLKLVNTEVDSFEEIISYIEGGTNEEHKSYMLK